MDVEQLSKATTLQEVLCLLSKIRKEVVKNILVVLQSKKMTQVQLLYNPEGGYKTKLYQS